MSITPPEQDTGQPDTTRASAEEYGLSNAQVEQAHEAIQAGDIQQVEEVAQSLHAADLADLIEELTGDERVILLDTLGGALDPEALSYLVPPVRQDVIEHIGPKGLAARCRNWSPTTRSRSSRTWTTTSSSAS